MNYKQVIKIKEPLSEIGLGCWAFSGKGFWDNCDDQESIRIIHAAIDSGINFFDTAPIYGMGHSEEIVGKAIAMGKRNQVFLASKCGLVWNESGKARKLLSKESILKEIDDSLQRLQTDYLDLYQLHWPDHSTPLEETIEAIEVVKKAGKIRYFGLTNYSVNEAEKIASMTEISSMQGLYNVLEQNPDSYHGGRLEYKTREEILPFCAAGGLAFFPYSPLMQGALAGVFKKTGNFSSTDVRSNNPKINGEGFIEYYEKVNKIKVFGHEIGRPINEIAINWLRQQQGVTSIIGSIQHTSELTQNLKALSWKLTDDDIEVLEKIVE